MSVPRISLRPWVIGLGLVAAGLVAYLLLADTPGDAARESAERIAVGKRVRPEADFVTALWIVAAVNLGIVLTLLATVRLWVPRLAFGQGSGVGPATELSRGFWMGLAVVVVLGGAMRYPLASGSLWWDELWGVKYCVVGYYIGAEDAPLEDRHFADSNGRRALWYYTRPTNHPAASFPARLSHVVWRAWTRPESPHEFSDFALRLPNFLASLGAIIAVALAGARWGVPRAGLAAAIALALHPWAIRYGVDLRGYSWVMLWTAMGLVWLAELSRAGRVGWRPWWGLGINQALLVWAFPHAVFAALGIFGAAMVVIFQKWKERGDRLAALGRLLLVNGVAGMLYLQVFSPNLLQMLGWLEEVNANHGGHAISVLLLGELACDLLAGDGLGFVGESSGGFVWLALGVVAAAAAGGMIRWWRSRRLAGVALTALVMAGVALLAAFVALDSYFYPRFAVFLVIPFVLLLGAAWMPDPEPKWQRTALRWLLVAAFLFLTVPRSRALLSHPFSPYREVAERVGGIESQAVNPVIFVCYGHGAEMMPLYVPEARSAVSLSELEALTAEAVAKGASLLVAYSYPAFNRTEVPDGFTWLDDPDRFAEVDSWKGIDPESGFTLLEWRGEEVRE